MALSAGDRLGPYVIVGPIGTGGMGEVFKARDERLARFVALKVLHTPTATDASLRDRFQREARAVAALSHPNIVTIFSIEEHDGSPFLTMELLEGQTLTELLTPGGAPLATFLRIAIPLADAVAAAHARGITHRDLKPGNVMVTADGHLKVLDFGLARLTEAPAGATEFTSVATEQLTGHGQILGTVAYMSPEQAEGKAIDHRSDIFSLGIILYELATGRKPFTGETNVALLSSILRDTPPLVSDVNPAMPGEIARLIRRCLEKNPAQRLQSCVDLKHELEDVRSELSGSRAASRSAPSLASPGVRQRSRLMVAACVLAVMVAGAGYLVWARWSTEATTSADAAPGDGAPIAVMRFENRTGEAALDPVGQMVADALSQELPQLRNTMQSGGGAGEVPVASAPATEMPHGTVTGAYYLDGENVRIQATLATDAGEVLYSIEPASGPRTDPGKAVDLAQQRILGAIVSWLDPNLGRAQLQRPPLFSAYREFKAGMSVFGDDPTKAVDHFSRAIELDPGFFSAWYGTVLAYNNLGDARRSRETTNRLRALNDSWSPKERALLAFLIESIDGRLLDGLQALRAAERADPADLSTNYLIGFYLVRLNRPQEAIDQYAKVNATSWNSVTVGTWRYARLATANHLLGRHEEELRVATIARDLFPTSFLSRNDQIAAFAALQRIGDLRKALDETQTIPMRGTFTPAESMRVAAEELRAHGRRAESIEMAKRAVAWHRNRAPDFLTAAANRFSLAQSLYAAEEWTEAGAIVSSLLREQPDSVASIALAGAIAARAGDRDAAMTFAASLAKTTSTPGGLTELRRAQLAALLGQREQAVELLRDAFARGLSMSLPLHRQMDLETLRGFAPYDELMKPRG
jgi:predicted Zn-dependent protease